jgi:hypothetical protein
MVKEETVSFEPWTKKAFVHYVMDEIKNFYLAVNTCGFVNWTALACAVMRGAAQNYPLTGPVTTLAESKEHLGKVFKKFKNESESDADHLDDEVMYFMAQIRDSLAAFELAHQDVEIAIHFMERHYRGDDRFECCVDVVVERHTFTYPLGATWEEALKNFPTIDDIKKELSKLDEFSCDADCIRITEMTGAEGIYA